MTSTDVSAGTVFIRQNLTSTDVRRQILTDKDGPRSVKLVSTSTAQYIEHRYKRRRR